MGATLQPSGQSPSPSAVAASPAGLPSAQDWQAAVERFAQLFDPLDPGARMGLLSRSDPTAILLLETSSDGARAWLAPFVGYAATAADIVLAADQDALDAISGALRGPLFEVLRAQVRAGHVVCYMLKRRCVLEERGFEELLEALGFVFMGACR